MIWLVSIAAIIVVILFLPVTLKLGFDGRFVYGVYIWFFKLPFGKKTKKQTEVKTVPVEKKKYKTALSDVADIIPKLVKHALKSMTITRLNLDITVATDDPYDTAILYGITNSTVYTVLGTAKNFLRIKNEKICVNVNYEADTITVGFEAFISTNVARLLVCLFRLLSDGLLKTLI